MVGVAGRSKGCKTCRFRRVKCDETHPTCTRCARARITCAGYARDVHFVDEIARASRPRKPRKNVAVVDPSDDVLEPYTLESAGAVELLRPGLDWTDNKMSKVTATRQRSFSLTPLSLGPFKDSMQQTFLMSHLFNGFNELYEPLSGLFTTRLLTQEPAMTALAQYGFGRLHRLRSCLNEGLNSYERAIRILSNDLQEGPRSHSVDVLVTCNLLSMFECMASNNSRGWLQHAGGVGRLIELRRPDHHKTPVERSVLEFSRLGIALRHLSQSKHCFLEQQEWKIIPWTTDPKAKGNFNRLLDVLVDIPGIAEDVADLQKKLAVGCCVPSAVQSQRWSLCLRISTLFSRLFNWRLEWERAQPHVSYEVFHPPEDTERNLPFQSQIHYTHLNRAYEIGLYNSLLLYLLRIGTTLLGASQARHLYKLAFTSLAACGWLSGSPNRKFVLGELSPTRSARQPSSPSPASQPKLRSTSSRRCQPTVTNPVLLHPSCTPSPKAIATEILRSAPYQLQPGHSSCMTFNLAMSLKIAFLTFEMAASFGEVSSGEPESEVFYTRRNNKEVVGEVQGDEDAGDDEHGPTSARTAEGKCLVEMTARLADSSGFEFARGLCRTSQPRVSD